MASHEETNPAWVRKCAEVFKKDKCKLASEERTLENWRRFNRRQEFSPYKTAIKLICPACDLAVRKSRRAGGKDLKCTCSKELAARLPVLAAMQDVPKELLWDEELPVGSGAPSRKSKTQGIRVKKEPTGDDTYYALMGDEGLDPMKINQEDLKQEEKEENNQAPEGEQARGGSDAEEGEDDGEDLEDADYGAGERYDDDDDLVDEEGGGSDDEAERYGTF